MTSKYHQFNAHVKRFLQEFEIITKLPQDVQAKIAETVVHTRRKAGYVLWKQGDPPDDGCYIVLSGEVQIWQSPTTDLVAPEVVELEQGNALVKRHARGILSIVEEEAAPHEELTKKSAKAKKKVKKGEHRESQVDTSNDIHMKTLGVGMMFGEVALLENQARFGTFSCKTDCELLHIRKSDFDRVLKQSLNSVRFKQLAGPMRQFLREFEFFQKMESPVFAVLPEIMMYRRYRAGTVLFKQNDPPDCLFISLTGEVHIYKDNMVAREDAAHSMAGSWAHKPLSLQMKAAAMLNRLHEKIEYTHQSPWICPSSDSVDLGGLIAKLGPGTIFGELALVDNVPRSASVICGSDSEFLCVSKDDFNSLMRRAVADSHMALPELVTPLLQETPFFNGFQPAVQQSVAYCMRHFVEPQGQVLFWEGDPPGCCYLIISGRIGVWKKSGTADMQKLCTKKTTLVTAGATVCEHCDEVTRRLSDMGKTAHLTDLVLQANRALKKDKANREDINQHGGLIEEDAIVEHSAIVDILGLYIASLGKGIVFGEQALLDDAPRNATITCEETCHLLVISRADFDRVVKQDVLRMKVKQHSGTIKRLLREFDLFKELSPSVQDQLADVIHYYKAKEGTLLFEQGDPPNFCYILLSGEVTIWKRTEAKTEPSSPIAAPIEAEVAAVPDKLFQISCSSPIAAPHKPADGSRRHSTGETIEAEVPDKPAGGSRRHSTGETIEAESPDNPADGSRRPSKVGPRGSVVDIGVKRPHPDPSSSLAREKCSNLANLLSAVAANGMNTFAVGENKVEDDALIQFTSDPVAALGAGALFGELALLNSQPRGATISCFEESEMLLIEKADFDRILKVELNKAKEDKLQFLRTHVPGVRFLKQNDVDRMMYNFHKVSVPKNHVFIRQGSMLHGDLFFVWQGSVESYSHLPKGGFRRNGILLRGSVFGAVPVNTTATFTVVATSSPCEVLHVCPQFRKHIPDSVLYCIRESMEQTTARQMVQCAPLMPLLPGVQSLSRRPTSSCNSRATNLRKRCLMPGSTAAGLFQRVLTEVDYKVFELTPGETIAMKAQRPQRREKRPGSCGSMVRPSSSGSIANTSTMSMSNPDKPSTSRCSMSNSRLGSCMNESTSAPSLHANW